VASILFAYLKSIQGSIKSYFKNNQMKKIIYLISFTALVLSSACHKIEGPGGTSAIRGNVTGHELKNGSSEITEVTCTHGALLEHGDYWLLNTNNATKYYYIYYRNPTWVSDADPHLAGRIGIEVVFNYSDSNTEIAQNTLSALNAITNSGYTTGLQQDIITIQNTELAPVPDADNGSTSFNIDISQQGKASITSSTIPIANERVYIIYGKNAYSSKDVRTNANGEFSFEGLQVGKYTVYVNSLHANGTGATIQLDKEIVIESKESINSAGTFDILY
jgi:hypothetical protein